MFRADRHSHRSQRDWIEFLVRWRAEPMHKLIALEDVPRLTGLDPVELLGLPDTQRLARIDEEGGRKELVRVPLRLLIETPDEEPRA